MVHHGKHGPDTFGARILQGRLTGGQGVCLKFNGHTATPGIPNSLVAEQRCVSGASSGPTARVK